MPYRNRLSSWAVVRLLPDMQRVVICRFRTESDAEGHRQALCRLNPNASFRVVFDVPYKLENTGKNKMHSIKVEAGDLVRDFVPDLLKANKQRCEAISVSPEEYLLQLKDLLIKKAEGVTKATPDEIRSEASDLYDILERLLDAHRIDYSAIEYERMWKRENLGGFEQRLKILWIEE